MRAINHTVTGATIGAVVGNPLLALPLALLSHLVLDSIPHSASSNHTSSFFKIELMIDAALSAAFLLAIIMLGIDKWPLLVACGVLGAAPDIWWFPYWLQELKGKPRKLDKIGQFLSRIQWSETKAGYAVEAVWLIGILYIFLRVTV